MRRVVLMLVVATALGACDNDRRDATDSSSQSTAPTESTNPLVDAGGTGTVALGAVVCGQRLAPAPAFETDMIAGGLAPLRSNGQGDIIVMPATEGQAGENATLAVFLAAQQWEISDQAMHLWDDVTHVSGQTCPDGRIANVRWSLNGEEQETDPSLYVARDEDEIILAYLPPEDPIILP